MTTLYVDRSGIDMELDGGAIVFRESGERVGTVPIAPLSRVFLRGNVRLAASLLGKLGEAGIGVVVLSGRKGRPTLMLARPHNDAARRVEQLRKSLDEAFCLEFARELVMRKLDRQREWLDQRRAEDMQVRYELTHAMRQLDEFRGRLHTAESLVTLRGLEGAAAVAYFAGLRAVVPPSLKFGSRNRRPPRDPFNALLSLTYTMIHAELAVGLYGSGFDPFVGYYHRLEFGRESLASDLLEPLRPIGDLFCLRLVRTQVLRADDFSTTDAGCLLGKAGRGRYYASYEEFSEVLRAAIGSEIEQLSKRVGGDIVARPRDDEDWDGE